MVERVQEACPDECITAQFSLTLYLAGLFTISPGFRSVYLKDLLSMDTGIGP
jgi:hypothetical protein